jgi:hypothetical protein
MILLLLSLLAYTFSPQDSCRRLVTLAEIPERALLFAELAAGESGQGMLDMGRLLEVSGRFEEAASYYRRIAAPGSDPDLIRWLSDRSTGSLPLDTALVFEAAITNRGGNTVTGLTMLLPVPVSHPPYQEIEITESDFRMEGDLLSVEIDSLVPGETSRALLKIQLRQEPYTFRPIPAILSGTRLDTIASIMAGIPVPPEFTGTGPCYDMSVDMLAEARSIGLELGITGGLVRRGDSLVFHAWNILTEDLPGLPLDPLFWKTDTLFAVGHCPTDVIPLWDLLSTEGSELVVLYPSQDADLEIGLDVFFAP